MDTSKNPVLWAFLFCLLVCSPIAVASELAPRKDVARSNGAHTNTARTNASLKDTVRIGAHMGRSLEGPLALAAPAPGIEPTLFFEGSRLFHEPWDTDVNTSSKTNACTTCHTNNGRKPPMMDGPHELWSPPLVGLGLLSQVSKGALRDLSDPNDSDGNGIFGLLGQGRFGWKANSPDLRASVGRALCVDMGIQNMAALDPNCHGTDATEDQIQAVMAYMAGLAVPDRPQPGSQALSGEYVFADIGCASCHTPTLKTRLGQTFHPFTNLLVHDMGPELQDATGNRLWRTAPLWTLGRQPFVSETHYLHDGRAKTLTAAILWHGGEAKTSSEAFLALDENDKANLIAFLNSL